MNKSATNSVFNKLQKIKDIVSATKIDGRKNSIVTEIIPARSKPILDKKKKKLPKPLWNELNDKYGSDHNSRDISQCNRFFNQAQVKFEWSSYDKREFTVNDKSADELNDIVILNHLAAVNKKKKLPEVAFLGCSNVGKSTLLNCLFTNLQHGTLQPFAKASNKAGFTKSLNFYNVGNHFRLVDTPGYGYHSTVSQGTLTSAYLKNRQQLLKCFLLISAEKKITNNDMNIINFLSHEGVPFDIVFTKIDKLKSYDDFVKSLKSDKITELPKTSQLYFTNSEKFKTSSVRFGIDRLRLSIMQACGLNLNTKPRSIV